VRYWAPQPRRFLMAEVLVVFTIEPPQTILQQGGSQKWKVQADRARQCDFLVCVQNRNGAGRNEWAWCEPTEPDKSAFLIAHIEDVVPSDEEGRFLVKISSFARIHVPNVWHGWRFPVRYMSLSDLGIDPATLDFQPVPEPSPQPTPAAAVPLKPIPNRNSANGDAASAPRPLSLADAKHGLAAMYGVSPDAIEITIRG